MIVSDMQWNVSDANPDIYELKKNGTLIKTGKYTSGETITLNISALSPGYWELTFTAYDRAGNDETISSHVMIYPEDPPIITSKPPAEYTITKGSANGILNWTATDRYPDVYVIYVNGTLNASGTWTNNSPITLDVKNFEVGTYTVRIIISDKAGHSTEDTIVLIVQAVPSEIAGIPLLYILIGVVALIAGIIVVFVIYKRRKK